MLGFDTQTVLPFDRCSIISADVTFDLVPIGVVVRQRCMNLRQRQMRIFQDNFLGGHAHLVPTGHPA